MIVVLRALVCSNQPTNSLIVDMSDHPKPTLDSVPIEKPSEAANAPQQVPGASTTPSARLRCTSQLSDTPQQPPEPTAPRKSVVDLEDQESLASSDPFSGRSMTNPDGEHASPSSKSVDTPPTASPEGPPTTTPEETPSPLHSTGPRDMFQTGSSPKSVHVKPPESSSCDWLEVPRAGNPVPKPGMHQIETVVIEDEASPVTINVDEPKSPSVITVSSTQSSPSVVEVVEVDHPPIKKSNSPGGKNRGPRVAD